MQGHVAGKVLSPASLQTPRRSTPPLHCLHVGPSLSGTHAAPSLCHLWDGTHSSRNAAGAQETFAEGLEIDRAVTSECPKEFRMTYVAPLSFTVLGRLSPPEELSLFCS